MGWPSDLRAPEELAQIIDRIHELNSNQACKTSKILLTDSFQAILIALAMRGQMMRLRFVAVSTVGAFATFGGSFSAIAQEAVTYEYDSLGRLIRTDVAGGPNSGTSTGMCFDRAGNRVQYVVGSSGLPACATQMSSALTPRSQVNSARQAQGK